MPRMGLTPDKVVAAAADLADREGIDAMSLSTIAGTLGVRVPSLYKHIGGLDDLQRRVAVDGASGLAATLAIARDGKHGREALLATGVAYRRYALRHPGRYAAIQRAAQAIAEFEELFGGVVADYGLRGEDAVHGVHTVRSALHGFVALENVGGFGRPEDLDASFYALIALVDRGLGSSQPAARRNPFRIPGLSSR
jgi:AcrR family transcriptional regulator